MSKYNVVIDPPAAVSGRTELKLNSGNLVLKGGEGGGVDWGESAIKAYLAEQQFGEVPTDYRVPNRIVSMSLILGGQGTSHRPLSEQIAAEELAREQLQQKVGLLQRQGGVLMRQREGGEPLYADIVTASLTVPDVYGETGGIEPNVVLKLECLPDFYGEEVTLSAMEESGQAIGVLKDLSGNQAVIKGDYPARARIILTEKGHQDQKGALWGFHSTFYSSLATSALFFDAVKMTPLNGSTSAAEAAAYSGKWLRHNTMEPLVWYPMMSTDLVSGGQLTHLGSYRVWARVNGWTGGKVRLSWSAGDASAVTNNPAAELTTQGAGVMCLLDLGEIRLEEPPIGEHWWRGVIQAYNTTTGSAQLGVDRIWLQPVDDGSGQLRATAVPTSTLLQPSHEPASAANLGAGTTWTNPSGAITTGSFSEVNFEPAGGTTASLALETFGFALPSGSEAVVHGIGVVVPHAEGPVAELHVQLLKAGALAGTAKAIPISANKTTASLGSSSDLWGTTWTNAQINATNFGVAFFATRLASTAVHHAIVYDPVQIIVYYSYSASPTEDAVLYSDRKAEARFNGAFRQDISTNAYSPISENRGDLPRLPPSGLENRACALFVKNSRGKLDEEDAAIDKVAAQVVYRPCWIGRT